MHPLPQIMSLKFCFFGPGASPVIGDNYVFKINITEKTPNLYQLKCTILSITEHTKLYEQIRNSNKKHIRKGQQSEQLNETVKLTTTTTEIKKISLKHVIWKNKT